MSPAGSAPIAYSVLPRFVDPILAGTMDSLICAPTFNITFANPGDVIKFYSYSGDGKPPRRILTTVCVEQRPVSLSFHPIECVIDDEQLLGEELEIFARCNGFSDFAELRRFYVDTYEVDAFAGCLVRWRAPGVRAEMGAVVGWAAADDEEKTT